MDCPKCGQRWPELTATALRGGCPLCLLEFAFAETEPPAEAADGSEAPPAHIGPYKILDTLGRGGMGVVYRARHESLGRTVALKVLNTACARQKGFPERFQREGQLLAALEHPSIVGVHDLGCESGVYFLAMEYVVGTTLRQLLTSGPLSWERALPIFTQIADALQYAHECGVVHRDVKPENVLVEQDGTVKIGDFGVAKLIGDGTGVLAPLTESGAVVGTRCYVAPEQLERGKAIDHRADLYALGVVLYEMLTGELPLGVFPPPSRKAAVARRLDGILLRALDKDRDRRPASVREFKEHVLASGQYRRRHRWAWAAGFLALLAVSGAWLVYSASPKQGADSGTSPATAATAASASAATAPAPEPPGRRRLTAHKGRVWAVAFADNGMLATAADDRFIRLWNVERGAEAAALEAYPNGELGYLAVAFAPGGQRLATAGGEGVVRIWDVTSRKLLLAIPAHGREVTALAFSPDGQTLATASHDHSVRLWDAATGKARRTLSGLADPALCVAFSPDGKLVAAGAMNGAVKLWDPETGTEVAKCGHMRRVWAIAFAPTNTLLATGSHDKTIKLWDLTARPLKAEVLTGDAEVWSLAFSPDGGTLAAAGHDGVICLWDVAQKKVSRRLQGHLGPVVSVAFSPDGHYLASASWDRTALLWDLRQTPP